MPCRLGFRPLIAQFACVILLAACGGSSLAEAPKTPAATGDSPRATTSTDSTRGRELFVSKGCVLCHSINGVGGRAGPPLDAPADGASDPVDFAARIWRGAPAMVELQSLELGYVIDLTSEEIRLLAAFAGSRSEQALLSKDDLPSSLADAVLDEDFWRAEDWREFLRNGQELTDTEE